MHDHNHMQSHVNNKYFSNPDESASKSNNTNAKKTAATTNSHASVNTLTANTTSTIKQESFFDPHKTSMNDSLNLNESCSLNLKLPMDILDNSNNFALNLSNKTLDMNILGSVLNESHNGANDSLGMITGSFNFGPMGSFDVQDTHASVHTPTLKTEANNNFSNFFESHLHKNIQQQNFPNAFNQNRNNQNSTAHNNNHHHKSTPNNHNINHNNQQQHHSHDNPLLLHKGFNGDSEEEDYVNWDNLL